MTVHQDYVENASAFWLAVGQGLWRGILEMRSWPLVVLAGLLALTPMAASADARADLAAAAQAFEQAALRIQDSDDKPRGVVRWAQPIVYAVRNAYASPTVEREAFAAVQRIAGIAGLSVQQADSADPRANYLVIFTDNEAPAMPGQAGSRTCFSRSSWKGGQMTKVELNLNFANIRLMQRCVVHEALHGFGFNSHPHSADSLLSYVYGRSDLTTLDIRMIETLYDRRLRPGMPRPEAAKQACRILGEKMNTPASDIEAVCPLRR
jgi:hypothetical protein